MSEEILSKKAREAIKHIRNWLMQYSKVPSVRELMVEMEYKSPRSTMLLMEELEGAGFLKRKADGGFLMIKDLESETAARTVEIPLVGTVTCGTPLLATENVDALIPVSIALLKRDSKYFLLKASGDSMDLAGIESGNLLLVRQQSTAENGEKVVALIDDEATVKEFHRKAEFVTLMPRSSNPKYQPIILESDFQIQGVVIKVIPSMNL